MKNGSIFPALKYRNAPEALAWLERSFGFKQKARTDRPDGSVVHAELSQGEGVLMVASLGTPDPKNPWPTERQALYMYVEDIDAHYQRARTAGVTIIQELHDTSYGSREYSALDIEGHLWAFGTYYPDT